MKMFKKSAVVGVILACSLFSLTQTAYAGTHITVNGKAITTTVEPYTKDGTTMVPLRVISENLGATVNYDKKSKTIGITKGSTKISMTLGSVVVKVNGETSALPVAPTAIKGTTMVPLRFVSESLGCQVVYNKKTGVIAITGKTSNSTTTTPSTPAQTVRTDIYGRKIRTTNLPKNASRFPYIVEGVPNWCYEQQPWDDNYWGGLYTSSLISAKASKVYQFPSGVYASGSDYASIIKKNYETIDAYIKAQTNVDYRTISQQNFSYPIANGTALSTTTVNTIPPVVADADKYVNYVKKHNIVIQTEYQILPETAWRYNSSPIHALNFSVYMKMKLVSKGLNANFNLWGTNQLYNTTFKLSTLKTGQILEAVVTYTLVEEKDGTWKIHASQCGILYQLAPVCNLLNGIAPGKTSPNQINKFDYLWTGGEKIYYTRYQKDCTTSNPFGMSK